jgi:hypothetical protein
MMKVQCDDRSGCVATADAKLGWFEDHIPMTLTPDGWTDNNGLGGVLKHFCPTHPQLEIAGG